MLLRFLPLAEIHAPGPALAAVELLLVLLSVVAVLVVIARRVHLPYPILLVVGGLALSFVPGLPRLRLDPELVFVLFLPPLLYPAALLTPWRDFRANLTTIAGLAVGLVLVTMIAVAWCAHRFIGTTWGAGFVLGAIVSPSDAVAAIAMANQLRLPRRLVTILEGESLVNDATAFVAYRFAIAAVVTGSFSLQEAGLRFFVGGVGGTLVGIVVGWIVTAIHRRLDDPPVEITVSLLTPFVCYLAAEALGCSGVLAVVVCGLFYGWRSHEVVGSRTRLRTQPVWEMVEFGLNGLIFILIGLQLPDVLAALAGRSVREIVWLALVVLVPVIGLRLLWLFGMVVMSRITASRGGSDAGVLPWREATLIGWTGMRGVESLAAALAVPFVLNNGAPFPNRDLVFFLTFAVIFGTLVLQGLSLRPMIHWLGVVDDRAWEKEERAARLKANEAALARLLEVASRRKIDQSALQRLTSEYEDRIALLETEDANETTPRRRLFSADYERLSQEALDVERQTILNLRNRLEINDTALRRIQHDIDIAETRLRREQPG